MLRCATRGTPSSVLLRAWNRVQGLGLQVVQAGFAVPHLLWLNGGHHPVRLAAVIAVHVVEDDPQSRRDEAHAEANEDEDAASD